MSLIKDDSSYIINPFQILSYDTRKLDGDLPLIKIGKKCSIATNCTFVLSQHLTDRFSTYPSTVHLYPHNQGDPSSYSKGDIIIKNDVWIGANCTILDGLTIGNGAVIGSGSVVVKNVPAYSIVCGNPAKVVKYRFSQDIIDRIEETNFWELPIEIINNFNIHTHDIDKMIKEIQEFKKLYY